MKLVVGLGNPGKKYQSSKHNVGFMCLDRFAKAKDLKFKLDKKFNGEWVKIDNYILLKPHTFMNNSGQSIKKIMEYFDVELDDLLIIYDDLDLPLGKLRLREQGSPGGHNGIKSVLNHLNCQTFKRVRVGIDRNSVIETKNYVLTDFSKQEMKTIDVSIDSTSKIIDEFINNIDYKSIMNTYN